MEQHHQGRGSYRYERAHIGGNQDLDDERARRSQDFSNRPTDDDTRSDEMRRQMHRYPLGGRGGDYEDDSYPGRRSAGPDEYQHPYGSRDDYGARRGAPREDERGRDWAQGTQRSSLEGRYSESRYGQSDWDSRQRRMEQGGAYPSSGFYGDQPSRGDGYHAGYPNQRATASPYAGSGDHSTRRTMQNRGPKGYVRSDERLKEDICERLMHSSADVSEVCVEVKDGKVSLEGTVTDRKMKHEIEDVVDGCVGVKDIDNRIRVTSSAATPIDQGSSSTGASGSSATKPKA